MIVCKPRYWRLGFKTPYEDTPVADLDLTALSHISQVGLIVAADGSVTDNTRYSAALLTACASAGVKVLLNINDATAGDVFSAAVTGHLATLVSNIMSAVNAGPYDGVDIDWEFAWNAANALTLLTELRRQLGTRLLTIDALVNNYADFTATLTAPLDRVNVMAYSMGGTWDPYTWFHAGVHDRVGDTGTIEVGSADLSKQRFIAAGTPATKINLAVAFYGQKSTGGSLNTNGPRQTYGTSPTFTEITYTNILGTYPTEAAAAAHDSVALVPWFAITGPTGWINYDDATSIAAKGAYVTANGLGGFIIWSLDKDYRSGDSVKHPLLAAVKTSINQP